MIIELQYLRFVQELGILSTDSINTNTEDWNNTHNAMGFNGS